LELIQPGTTIVLNCRQAALLISQNIDRDLSLWRRMLLYVHLGVCRSCRVVRRQLTRIKDESRATGIREDELVSHVDRPGMPPEMRQKLKDRLRTQGDAQDL